MTTLKDIAALIIDMDGVLWHDNEPLPGLIEFFELLRKRNIKFVLATNNAGRTPEQYQEKLLSMGVSVAKEEILTSSQATALYLKGIAKPSSKVFVIGEEGLKQPLREMGFEITTGSSDYVVCGMDRGLNWEKLAQATLNIRAGAMFLGTNPDTTYPTERGVVHGNGAILAALKTASNVEPVIIGKPEPIMYQQAMLRLGTNKENTVALGDRLETDILGAKRASIASIMVLTGISTLKDLEIVDYKPEWVLEGLPEVIKALEN
ncbi:MAG: HAD family hydrolase [Acidobacteria bacterium]|nr:HAD family hydrolase [Acidobacteriota bacterium]